MELRGQPLSLNDLAAVALEGAPVKISKSARPRILASRKVIDSIINRDAVVYGVNTGFGKLSDVRIRPNELRDLQLNLVRSHACGIGPPLSEAEVRAMMLLRANVLTLGFSGIRLEVIEMLCEMLNRGLHPVVPERGSVGASGDLAPLAHLALSLVGEGGAFFKGELVESRTGLHRAGLRPLRLMQFLGESHHYADLLVSLGDKLQRPVLLSTVKLRQAGFHACRDSEDSVRRWIRELQDRRLIPRPHGAAAQ